MKKELMFFLNLHAYVMLARVCLIPAAFFLFFARGAVLMSAAAVIFAILLVISIIRAPSDEEILKGIKQFHDEFLKRVLADTETKRYNETKILTGYRHDSRAFLKRHVNGKYVYSCILDVGIARKGSDYTFYTDELNLLRKNESQRNQYPINPSTFRYTYEALPSENAAILEFMLPDTNTHISILVEADYHLRDFRDMIKEYEK